MAIHTGQIELRHGDYYGPTVNRCARLRAVATGGQVLLSTATADLTRAHLPPGASLTDFGTHQLKDLSAPEHIWQLVHPQMTFAEIAPDATESLNGSGARPHAYKVTDHLNRSTDGREWAPGVQHEARGRNPDGSEDSILCYTSPTVAALLNAQYERFRMPRARREEHPGHQIRHRSRPDRPAVDTAGSTRLRRTGDTLARRSSGALAPPKPEVY
jgi:hypothetical protein